MDTIRTRGFGNPARGTVAAPHFNNLSVLDRTDNKLPGGCPSALWKRWPFVEF